MNIPPNIRQLQAAAKIGAAALQGFSLPRMWDGKYSPVSVKNALVHAQFQLLERSCCAVVQI